MLPLRFAIERIESVLDEISRLKDSDFPYEHSKDGLRLIEKIFEERLASLRSLTPENSQFVVFNACSEAQFETFVNLPLLGFILRSTNVRNSFEIFGPLLRLARDVLGPETKLIVSSEWDFSPHVYPPNSRLPHFVLLGLPASESPNPLLVPLAGHELGHTAWHLKKLSQKHTKSLADAIQQEAKAQEARYRDLFGSGVDDSLFANRILAPANDWALRQAEESFCDFLGLRIFGESYLYAFGYIATPSAMARSVLYPSITDRVKNLLNAADRFGIAAPDDFDSWFLKQPDPKDRKEKFLVELADGATSASVDSLVAQADEIASNAGLPHRNEDLIERVLRAFKLMTPASQIGDLISILNAAWKGYNDPTLWQHLSVDKSMVLNELVLKSIEILEFESRVRTNDS